MVWKNHWILRFHLVNSRKGHLDLWYNKLLHYKSSRISTLLFDKNSIFRLGLYLIKANSLTRIKKIREFIYFILNGRFENTTRATFFTTTRSLSWLSQLNGPLDHRYPLEIIESELRRSRKNEMLLLYSSLETLYFESWVHLHRFREPLNIKLWNLQYFDYRMCVIIIRGLYTFYPLLKDHFFIFKEFF